MEDAPAGETCGDVGNHFGAGRELDAQVLGDRLATGRAEETRHGVVENRLQQVVVLHLLY